MHVVVCIKQVPDTQEVRIDPETNTLIRTGIPLAVNQFDLHAVDEAVRLVEKYGGKSTVLTMGPPQADEALRTCLSMGIDEAIHLTDRKFAGSDTWATSYIIAQANRHIGDFDLVICGKQAVDGDTGQVGPGVATQLGVPQLTYTNKVVEIDEASGKIKVERLLEAGTEVVETTMPCLLTVLKGINEPRFPSLVGKRRAKKTEIPIWTHDLLECEIEKIGLKGSPTRVAKVLTPELRSGGEMLEGEPAAMVSTLMDNLSEDGLI